MARGESGKGGAGQARHEGDSTRKPGLSGNLEHSRKHPRQVMCAGFLCMAPPRAGNDTKDASRVSGLTCPSSSPAPTSAQRLPRGSEEDASA